jgi:proteasome lid subunit RPN8/RPN11/DNA-directed RNA polymerase subunit RPC12/RpoP
MLITHVDQISEERGPIGPGTELKTWSTPQCPFLMECSSAVLEQIRREVEGARDLLRGERETGGVLYGVHDPNRLRILACKPLQCEYAMGPGFVLSERDEKRLAQLIMAPATESELNSLRAVGWYHSHIRSRIFLSERDLLIHSRYFAAPYQIALVIHPATERPARAGFFFREASGEMRTESSYEEFTIETPRPAAPELKQAVVSKQAPSHRRTPSPVKLEQQTEPICPRCGSKHLRRSRRTGSLERLREVFGFHPYRCHECLSRSFLKTSPDLLESARSGPRKRPEERKRAWQRTRREMLLWGGGILGFAVFLYYVVRDTGPKQDPP